MPGCLSRLFNAGPGAPADRRSSFAGDRRASVATTFSLSMIPLFGFIALGVDYGRSLDVRAEVQHATDAAVLAGASMQGSSLTASQRQTFADNYFMAAMHSKTATITTHSFAFNSTSGALTGTVVANMPTMVGQYWQSAFTVNITSTASVATKVRALDVVMCIDATGSMQSTLSTVQSNALSFKTNLDATLLTYGIAQFDQMRVRVIYYRDFGGNGWQNLYPKYYYPVSGTALGDAQSLVASSFFILPAANSTYGTFVNSQSASGGGDLPESGLECLNEALNSTFVKVGDALPDGRLVEVTVPVISIYTDAGAHQPNFYYSVQNPNYPKAMPLNYAGLLSKWTDATKIDQTNSMILFYGNPSLQDDQYYNAQSAWTTVMTWPRFSNPGSLTSANTSFVSSLASAIATNYQHPTLTQ